MFNLKTDFFISISIAVVVEVILWFVATPPSFSGIYLGFFVFLSFNVLKIWDEINKLKVKTYNICSKLENTPLDRFWNKCLEDACKGRYEQNHADKIVIPKDQAPKFWRRMLIRPVESWYCTDIVKPNEKWGYGWSQEIALGFQQYAIEENATVKRLFIVESNQLEGRGEEDIKNMMHDHEKVGVAVRWLCPSLESGWVKLSQFEDELDTKDFVIADKKYIIHFYLDDDLNHNAFGLTKNEEVAQKLFRLYETLWLTAKPVCEFSKDYLLQKSTP